MRRSPLLPDPPRIQSSIWATFVSAKLVVCQPLANASRTGSPPNTVGFSSRPWWRCVSRRASMPREKRMVAWRSCGVTGRSTADVA